MTHDDTRATIATTSLAQGFGRDSTERLPLPTMSDMSEAQRAAAQAIIDGPRKALFGPYVPLLETPALMEALGKLGEILRFQGALPDAIRELAICVVAREVGNQFEWQTHAPLAERAGVAAETIQALAEGRHPRIDHREQRCALDVVAELLRRNGVCDATYAEALACFGKAGTVELIALVGYFTTVCWVMNVARTPGPAGSGVAGLAPFPL